MATELRARLMSGKQAASLSEYRGKKVTVICEECEVLQHFGGDELFGKHGDASMPELLGNLPKPLAASDPRMATTIFAVCSITGAWTNG